MLIVFFEQRLTNCNVFSRGSLHFFLFYLKCLKIKVFFREESKNFLKVGNQMAVLILYSIMKVKHFFFFFLPLGKLQIELDHPHLGFIDGDPLCNFSLILVCHC